MRTPLSPPAITAPGSSADAGLRRLYGLQYLRALAAVAVLAVHALRADSPPWGLLGTGVDLFFLLSGFLMVAITDERSRPWPFLKARLLRITPLYWIMTLAALGLVWGLAVLRDLSSLLHGGAGFGRAPWPYIMASFAFVPWMNPGGNQILPLLPPGWTLNLEIMFYLVFSFTLLWGRFQLLVLTAILSLLVILGRISPVDWTPVQGWTNPIILEFLAGAWIGCAWRRGGRLWPVVVAVLVLWIPLGFLGSMDIGLQRSLLPAPVFACHVALLAAALWVERRPGGAPDWPPLRLLGDASYSIYLWQFIPYWLMRGVEARFHTPDWVFVVGVFVAGLVGGLVVHFALERPLLKVFRRGTPGRYT